MSNFETNLIPQHSWWQQVQQTQAVPHVLVPSSSLGEAKAETHAVEIIYSNDRNVQKCNLYLDVEQVEIGDRYLTLRFANGHFNIWPLDRIVEVYTVRKN